MRVGSLFSGIGGLELGLERAGLTTVLQAEYDKQARSVLAKHWPEVHQYEDVHDVRDSTAVDVICGGFPCQDYSVAGKRGGLVGDRGALWWEMHRIVAECRPTWVIGENVPGLLSSNGGRDFLAIIGSLVQLGYGVTWATLDSQYFGVAQRRRRLFIVGHSGGVPRPEILAISEGLRGHPAPSREAGQEVASCLGTRSASGHDERGDGTSNIQVAEPVAFTSESVHQDGTHQDGTHHPLRVKGQAAIAYGYDGGQSGKPKATDLMTVEGSPPLTTALPMQVGGATTTPRRLTPRECERLQGFPDDWTRYYHDGKQVADGPRYRMLGNAVTVNVAEWIGKRIREAT